ncbi:phenazine-specific anthranilate synthase component I [Saccharothrix sp. ALI-22-I]|uniref:anthranilate synthase family protein n=1 Tax=Saccharothrix sp. ALI-22-I TaxID=1933778 RepID=UPI00097CA360|nr:anthranilate synthase family protein [Saccharothrix sp. ALI-22-I]ONI92669.1 phenazine-specific anthranilate synthase component I [Saccharothrix sp. ALI-22-I]
MNPVDVDRLFHGAADAFALLHRPVTTGADVVELLVGNPVAVDRLVDLPLPPAGDLPEGGRPVHDLLTLVPFRQIAERGFAHRDDGAPLLALEVTGQAEMAFTAVVERLPDEPIEIRDGAFDVDDDNYAAIVEKVLAEEIGWGAGANFVIKRSFTAELVDYTPRHALSVFRRLLLGETGAYWTFLVCVGGRVFIGATPERHVSSRAGTVTMNPISGTYRYPADGPSLPELLSFLADPKETDELYMVVDEELKMMGGVCDGGVRVHGPYLKEMARLAHTEYLLEGHTTRDVTDVLRETMFAPTVTGSPLENACRVISRYEPRGRGYYSGVVALIGRDAHGARTLDSAIVIRTAEVDADGRLDIGVGATLVRHSDPRSEVAETTAKAAGLLAAIRGDQPVKPVEHVARAGFADHPDVLAALHRRNATLASFWFAPLDRRIEPVPALLGRKILVIDAEDTFTAMLALQLRSLGPEITVRRFDEPLDLEGYDVVLVGPGPGDPRDDDSAKIAAMRHVTGRLLDERRPFLSVCLGHQVLSGLLGFSLMRKDLPNQGMQRGIDLFGRPVTAGFYNTFAVRSAADAVECPGVPGLVRVSRDPDTGEVHALRGPWFASVQFHAESVLTEHGPMILGDMLTAVLADTPVAR